MWNEFQWTFISMIKINMYMLQIYIWLHIAFCALLLTFALTVRFLKYVSQADQKLFSLNLIHHCDYYRFINSLS